jgi:hypothetical protein
MYGAGSAPGRLRIGGTATADALMTLDVRGGVGMAIAAKAANYAMTGEDFAIIASGAGTTITLPAAANVGQVVYVKRNDASNAIAVHPASGTIDGSGSDLSLASNFAAVMLISDGANWWKLATL